MQLDVRTLYVTYAVLYLLLHGIIWFSLSRYQNLQVRRWSAAGIVSAVGIGLLALQGVWPDWVVAVFGQLLMAAGNLARQHVLRSLDVAPGPRWLWRIGGFHLGYLLLNGLLFQAGASHAQMMVVFYAFYALICLEFFHSGRAIGRSRQTSGARTVQLGGLVFVVSLGIKALALLMGWGAQGLYDPGWDQVALFASQFLAIGLLNFGFMQVFVDQFQQERLAAEQNYRAEQDRALRAERASLDLARGLREREEILRQLTLSSKTAGMGALVSGIAHEINQPLTTIVLKSELIDHQLTQPSAPEEIHRLCEMIREDSYRAAGMISTLRSMFGMNARSQGQLDFVQLLSDVLGIVRNRADELAIEMVLDWPATLRISGDGAQLQQVVLNLLNNAIQAIAVASPPHPRLVLQVRLQEGMLDMSVRDNGCGIESRLQADVFALFKSAQAGHMGVGLWLSHAVVQSHGGTLSFESTPGQGTVFTLQLPARDNRADEDH